MGSNNNATGNRKRLRNVHRNAATNTAASPNPSYPEHPGEMLTRKALVPRIRSAGREMTSGSMNRKSRATA